MNKSILNNLSFSFVAQILSVIVSLIFSLGITKVLDVENYGYWQLFILYSNYAGFFHLGICDGLYLKWGGKKLERINQFNFTNQLSFFLIFEILVSILFLLGLLLTAADPIKFHLLLFIVPYIIIANVQTYLSYVLLATNQIEVYSKSVFIEKIFIIIILILLFFLKKIDVNALIYVYLLSKILSILYLVFQIQTIVEVKGFLKYRTINLRMLSKYAIIGIPLMFSNILSSLLIGSNRLLTENKYGIIAFSKLSFSISLVFLFIVFVSQLGIVLFPLLRRMNSENRKLVFYWINNNLTLLFIFCMLFYYPLVEFVKHFVPNYYDSTKYLSLMLPICIFEGKFQILYNTMYKVLKKQKTIFMLNLLSLGICIVLTYVALYLFNSIMYSIYILVFVIMLRSTLSEITLYRLLTIKKYNLIVEVLFMALFFIIVNTQCTFLISFICYSSLLVIYILIKYFRNEIKLKFNTIN
ncbi:hypothetical protein [Chryseobacterium balustinum]|uniref:hypothetical protein n=1 Tax=Chryseobacterium balustinum TaxID=246 RepID=UPI003CF6FC80